MINKNNNHILLQIIIRFELVLLNKI